MLQVKRKQKLQAVNLIRSRITNTYSIILSKPLPEQWKHSCTFSPCHKLQLTLVSSAYSPGFAHLPPMASFPRLRLPSLLAHAPYSLAAGPSVRESNSHPVIIRFAGLPTVCAHLCCPVYLCLNSLLSISQCAALSFKAKNKKSSSSSSLFNSAQAVLSWTHYVDLHRSSTSFCDSHSTSGSCLLGALNCTHKIILFAVFSHIFKEYYYYKLFQTEIFHECKIKNL